LAVIAERQRDYPQAYRLVQRCLAILERQGSPKVEAARQELMRLETLLKREHRLSTMMAAGEPVLLIQTQ